MAQFYAMSSRMTLLEQGSWTRCHLVVTFKLTPCEILSKYQTLYQYDSPELLPLEQGQCIDVMMFVDVIFIGPQQLSKGIKTLENFPLTLRTSHK